MEASIPDIDYTIKGIPNNFSSFYTAVGNERIFIVTLNNKQYIDVNGVIAP